MYGGCIRKRETAGILSAAPFFPIMDLYPENPELMSWQVKEQFTLGFVE
jgi:hypothetical protein